MSAESQRVHGLLSEHPDLRLTKGATFTKRAKEMAAMVSTMFVNLRSIVVLLATLGLGGCGERTHGVSESFASWQAKDQNSLPGVEEASVTVVTLKGDPARDSSLVVWSDLAGGGTAQGRSTDDRASYAGIHQGSNSRQFSFHCEIARGNIKLVTIDGRQYDLAKGALFLVSTQRTPFAIAQLGIQTSAFPTAQVEIQKIAKSDPRIKKFFSSHLSAIPEDQR